MGFFKSMGRAGGSLGGGGDKNRGQGWGVGGDPMARKRTAMAAVLDNGDFTPPSMPQGIPGGHDPTARKMAMRPDIGSSQNLVNTGQSVFQTGVAPTLPQGQPGAVPPTGGPMPPQSTAAPMGGDMAQALRRAQIEQRRQVAPSPDGMAKQSRRINTMGGGLRGPGVPTGALPAAFGAFLGRR